MLPGKSCLGPFAARLDVAATQGASVCCGARGGHWRAGSAEPLRSGRGRQCRVWRAGRHAVYSSCLQRSAVADRVPRAALAGGPHAGGFQAVRKRPQPVDCGLAICNCMWPGSAAWTRGKEGQTVSALSLTTRGTGCHTRGLNPKLNRRRVVGSWGNRGRSRQGVGKVQSRAEPDSKGWTSARRRAGLSPPEGDWMPKVHGRARLSQGEEPDARDMARGQRL